MKLLRHTFIGGSVLDFFFYRSFHECVPKILNTLRNTVERIYLQSIIMGNPITKIKQKLFKCFFHAFFTEIFKYDFVF